MGFRFFDQYSLLHFATGIIAYFWGLTFETFLGIHIVFELLENTEFGIKTINKFPFWPGGKRYSDSLTNIIGDNVFAVIGWLVAKALDDYGNSHKWVLMTFKTV